MLRTTTKFFASLMLLVAPQFSAMLSAADFEIKDITWKMGPPLPGACKGQAQAVIGTDVIGVGSAEFGKRESDTVWRLDTQKMRYETLTKPPVVVSYPQGVAVGNDFYLFTGNVQDSNRKPPGKRVARSNRMFRLSRSSGDSKWTEMPPLRVGRLYSGAAVSGTTIVVIGGEVSEDHKETASVEAFDTVAPDKGWFELPQFPGKPRCAMVTVGIGKNIYVIGGMQSLPQAVAQLADAFVLNLETRTWRRLPDSPVAVDNWEGAVYKNRYIIMAGGLKRAADGKRVPNFDVVVYDTAKETYRIMPTRLPPYQVHPYDYAAWVADAMFKLLQDSNIDPKVGTYRAGAEVSVVGDRVFVCGGEVVSPEFNVTNEVLVGTIHE